MSNDPGIPLVLPLDDASASRSQVGGKGASLARMAAAGLPVPPGFHITTAAYRRFVEENGLQEEILAAVSTVTAQDGAAHEEASRQIGQLFAQGMIPDELATAIGHAYAELGRENLPVAVRSSATAEDLPELSFAGQQDTYLNIRGESQVLDAVKRCWASLWTARAIEYRMRHQIAPEEVSLAVVVQVLVPAEVAGILFTANPVNGARDQLMINAAWGLGEAIVGGLVTPDTFIVNRADGTVVSQEIHDKDMMTVRTAEGTREEPVPADRGGKAALSPTQATELARLGVRIEALYGQPMDIEWALSQGRFSIVQARPITTLRAQAMEEWNDSLTGTYLWTSGNLGEAVPDVMTPCSWSLIQIFMSEAMSPLYAPGFKVHHPIGNIGGRFYMNMSLMVSMGAVVGARKTVAKATEEVFGRIPDDLDVPLLPMTRWQVLAVLLPAAVRIKRRVNANKKKVPAFVAAAPARCQELRAGIAATTTAADLITLWRNDVEPFFRQASLMLEVGARSDSNSLVLFRRKLRKLVGEADTNALLSGQSELESLGLLVGLERLSRGEIDRATFAQQYGHRGPHEFEVSIPRPGEDPHWIDEQLTGLREAPVDVTTRLSRQKAVHDAAWERFQKRFPRQAKAMRRKLEKASVVFHLREKARSEVIRCFWVLRVFVLRAGEFTGLGEDIFYLSIDEILSVLGGDKASLASIPARRAAYERYSTLPPYPRLIVGHFDPFKWAADPNRNSNIFDARGRDGPASDKVTGFPGAAGVVEGRARMIATPEEGDQLQPGEILVTTVTNVGWTPLFPRAAAIVTDVGAPLSHAAIVARELGIPAVVGCGNATMCLHTGDWVRVNGEQGTVEMLRGADAA
jgi:phosphohistidine swiveling domain-containing protein/predicted secreted protein